MPVAGDDLREYLVVPRTSLVPVKQSFPPNHDTPLPVDPESRPDTPRFHKSAKGKTEDINMEVEYPAPPAKLSSVHAGEDTAITAPLEGVYTLEDFLSNHQADHDAYIAARETTKAPPAKKSKTSNDSTAPQPVAVGARSSKYTILLHEKCQALAISQPVFTYSGSSDTRWAVEVSFPGLANAEELQGLKDDGRFNSKQEAKESISKRALGVLEELEKAGKVAKAGKTKKQQSEAMQQQPKEREAPSDNYIGQLLEFQRATSAPQPTYTDYQLGSRWACLMEIEGHEKPFGSLEDLFGSKKAARQHAAGCAVDLFKSQGSWAEEFSDVGGIKKKKLASAVPVAVSSSSPDGRKASTASSGSSFSSATQQVASLAIMLNLGTPEWRFTHEDSSVPDIHTVSCYFKDGGAHEGPIGEVRNIFGKKKAKEECARLTMQYLTDLKDRREEIGRRMMAGISGGAEVADVAVGKAMDGEEDMARKQVRHEIDDEDFDIYEDAMEH